MDPTTPSPTLLGEVHRGHLAEAAPMIDAEVDRMHGQPATAANRWRGSTPTPRSDPEVRPSPTTDRVDPRQDSRHPPSLRRPRCGWDIPAPQGVSACHVGPPRIAVTVSPQSADARSRRKATSRTRLDCLKRSNGRSEGGVVADAELGTPPSAPGKATRCSAISRTFPEPKMGVARTSSTLRPGSRPRSLAS